MEELLRAEIVHLGMVKCGLERVATVGEGQAGASEQKTEAREPHLEPATITTDVAENGPRGAATAVVGVATKGSEEANLAGRKTLHHAPGQRWLRGAARGPEEVEICHSASAGVAGQLPKCQLAKDHPAQR